MRASLLATCLLLSALGMDSAGAELPPGSVKTVGVARSHAVSTPLYQMTVCGGASAPAATVPRAAAAALPAGPLSNPIVSFEGPHRAELRGQPGCDLEGFASDVSGAVGRNHFVQVVNFAIAVYDKTGNLLVGPVGTTEFWNAQPHCGGDQIWSDMVVIYDRQADRWIVSRPGALPDGQDLCLAISRTPDPTGSYDQYAFAVNNAANGLARLFNDYPKISTFGDVYLATADPNKIFSGLGNTVSAFDRGALLAGAPAPAFVTFFIPAPVTSLTRSHMLPADIDGGTPPPGGSPAFVVQVQDAHLGYPAGRLQVYELEVDWDAPASATLEPTTTLAPAPFNSLACEDDECITQPGTPQLLDSMAYGYMMYRLSYRNFGSHQTLLFNHTVAADGDPSRNHAGIRWYELRRKKGHHAPWTIYQQGTHAPDASNRWLGSIAMDRSGNIALAYSVSGTNTYPSLRYVGRRATDPPGTLPHGEITIADGFGVQQSLEEYGDYSQMTLDPLDDCTFWYTGTYNPATTLPYDWHTRIVAFRFASCGDRHPGRE